MMPGSVRIEKMLYGGNGLAHDGSREIQIPFVLPGELVEIAAQGGARIIEPSPDRVAPQCVHFLSCGGCHYQHASYPAQLSIKAAILRDAFAAMRVTSTPEIVTHSGEPWRYRNRIRLRVGEVDSEFRVGYNHRQTTGDGRETGSDTFLPIIMCPISAPLLWRAADTLVRLAKTELTVALWMKAAIEIELFTNEDESKLQLTLFIRRTINASLAALCTLVQQAVPQLAGAGIAILPPRPSPRGRRSERARPGASWGVAGLMYAVEEESFWVSRGSFFQVDRFLLPELAQLATAGRGGALVWDLYAGVGLFSRALTKSFAQVVAVEAAEPAATDLASSVKGKHRAAAMTTLDFLQTAVIQRDRPDLIVMDPPRAGIGAEVCALLGRIAAPELVYVSCDPITLARDIRQLIDLGYRLAQLHMVDMFPQTFHQEAVAVLAKSPS